MAMSRFAVPSILRMKKAGLLKSPIASRAQAMWITNWKCQPTETAIKFSQRNKQTKVKYMSKKSVFCIATSRNQADQIVEQLKNANFSNNSISALFADKGTSHDFAHEKHTKADR